MNTSGSPPSPPTTMSRLRSVKSRELTWYVLRMPSAIMFSTPIMNMSKASVAMISEMSEDFFFCSMRIIP